MLLEKWYGDFVHNGCPEIRYLANLHFGPVIVGYRGKLGEKRFSTTTFGFHGVALPSVRGKTLYWPSSADGVDLIWNGAQVQPRILWQQGRRVVTWEPIVLNGAVFSERGQEYQYGYVERLTLNFAPWHLGLTTLKWGRFCGKKYSLVWIEWLGRIPNKLALLNGDIVELLEAERNAVTTESASLAIGLPREIVNEPLNLGAVSGLGWTRFFDKRKFLSGLEIKWVADGILEFNDEQDYGSVIYEEVTW